MDGWTKSIIYQFKNEYLVIYCWYSTLVGTGNNLGSARHLLVFQTLIDIVS